MTEIINKFIKKTMNMNKYMNVFVILAFFLFILIVLHYSRKIRIFEGLTPSQMPPITQGATPTPIMSSTLSNSATTNSGSNSRSNTIGGLNTNIASSKQTNISSTQQTIVSEAAAVLQQAPPLQTTASALLPQINSQIQNLQNQLTTAQQSPSSNIPEYFDFSTLSYQDASSYCPNYNGLSVGCGPGCVNIVGSSPPTTPQTYSCTNPGGPWQALGSCPTGYSLANNNNSCQLSSPIAPLQLALQQAQQALSLTQQSQQALQQAVSSANTASSMASIQAQAITDYQGARQQVQQAQSSLTQGQNMLQRAQNLLTNSNTPGTTG